MISPPLCGVAAARVTSCAGGPDNAWMLLRVDRAAGQLSEVGFVVLGGEHSLPEAAWRAALDVIAAVVAKDPTPRSSPRLATLAEYRMPTRELPGRSFQVLHFDFGLPLALSELSDITRFTALFVDPGLPPSR